MPPHNTHTIRLSAVDPEPLTTPSGDMKISDHRKKLGLSMDKQ